MPDSVSKVKRAELIAHLAELDHIIENQTANVKFAVERCELAPKLTVRLEGLKEVRRLDLSAFGHLLGKNIDKDELGNSSR